MTAKQIPKFLGKSKDISGQRFGRLVAIKPIKERRYGKIIWECLCDCGKICFVVNSELYSGDTRSCGCLRIEKATKSFKTHGMTKTLIYDVWRSMNQRCHNPSNKSYKNYGGRGITVCDRWRHSFENFYADMGPCPPGLTLERKNNDEGYSPENCCYATRKQQANNSRPVSCGKHGQRWFYGHSLQGHMIIENKQKYVAEIFGLRPCCISACLNGKRKTHKDWTFQWLPE